MSKLIEIINQVSSQLIKIDEELQIYQIMNDAIRMIIPDVYFLITKLQPDDMNFRITHSFGFDKFINPIQTLLGKNPFEMDFPFSDMDDAKQKAYESGELFRFDDGLFGLVNGKINRTICKTIERIIGISQTYAISFSVEKNYFGGASFFIPKETIESGVINEETKLAIETIAFQASHAINSLRYIHALEERENELIISQNRFTELVNLMNDIVWKANGDGTETIDLNNSFLKYYGFPASDFNKNPNLWFEVVHPEDKEIVQQATEKLFSNGKTECEYRIIKPDGKIIWLHDRISVIFDKHGSPVQMGGVATDITDRKLLENQLRLKNYALDNSSSSIGLSNLDGTIFYVNNAFTNLFGYSNKSDIIGKHIYEFSSKGRPSGEELLNYLKDKKTFFGEAKLSRKDGTTFTCIVSAKIVKYKEKPVCIMAVFTDITEQSEMKAKLREQSARLSKLNKDKDKFFSIIAHDLKSPFSSIMGFSELLVEQIIAKDYNGIEQYAGIIQQSSQRAVDLLSNLMEWSRSQTGRMEFNPERFDLTVFINDIILLFDDIAGQKGIAIKRELPPNATVFADQAMINIVLRNLISNAIKFTKPGGEITLAVREEKNKLTVSLKDNGIGIPNDSIDKLFRIDENYSTRGTANETGTGLGLILCKEFIEKHDGEIWVESEEGKGSIFNFTLPDNVEPKTERH